MHPLAPRILGLALILLMSFTAAIPIVEGWRHDEPRPAAVGFQRLVGGLGLGGEIDLSRCAQAFDLRLSAHCSFSDEPIPGGEQYCPCHSGSVFSLAPLRNSAHAFDADFSERR